ncbi:MAG: DNA repair protein RecO [Planctomycetota bacterium]
MVNYHHTEGVCLRRIAYSNTSQVASFLTPEGRLSVIAKGVTRAPKKGVRTGLDLLGRYELIYAERPDASLQNLTYRWLREGFGDMRLSLKRTLCGYYAAELMLNFVAEGDPCPALYRLMLESLRRFAGGRRLALSVLILELGALREHGSCPTFDACAGCSGALPRRGAVLFSLPSGGPVCRRCEREEGLRPGARVTAARADLLRTLAALSRDLRPEAAPGSAPQKSLAMSTLVRFHMRDLLGKELRMWKYLERRELSRTLRRQRQGAGLS